jgi:hypothetical protein
LGGIKALSQTLPGKISKRERKRDRQTDGRHKDTKTDRQRDTDRQRYRSYIYGHINRQRLRVIAT